MFNLICHYKKDGGSKETEIWGNVKQEIQMNKPAALMEK